MEENPNIANYVRWLETLGKTGTGRVSQFVSADVRCRTPEMEASGPKGVAAIYDALFVGASAVKIRVLDVALGASGHNVYLRWDRLVTPNKGKTWSVSGVTELTIGLDGKFMAITDYWDDIPENPKGLIARLFNR